MSLAALIRSMAAAGAPPEAIAIAVEALETAQARPARGASAERMARKRARDREGVTGDADVTSQVTASDARPVTDPLPLPPLPQTPSPPTPSPGENTSRGREATPDQLSKVAVLRQAFATFWAEYPRKKAKPDAEKAYAKALAKPGVTPAVILDGLRRHLGGWATGDPEFVPHPATWLNREGWNDEADPPRPAQPRLIHERPRHDPDQRAAAYARRVQDVGDAADVAARAWHAERGH